MERVDIKTGDGACPYGLDTAFTGSEDLWIFTFS